MILLNKLNTKKIIIILIIALFITAAVITTINILKTIEYNKILQTAEGYFNNAEYDNSVEQLQIILKGDGGHKKATELLLQIQEVFLVSADSFIDKDNYISGIELYNKALLLNQNKDIQTKLGNTLKELEIPKIFIGDTPLAADIFVNNQFKSLSLNRLPPYSDISAPAQTHQYEQGSILRIKLIFPEALAHYSISLLDSNYNAICSSSGFKIDTRDNFEYWYAFIGLSCKISPGTYKLTGEGLYLSGDTVNFTAEIDIIKYDFPTETIYLNKTLTTLLTEPSTEKTQERRYLRNIISQSNPNSIFEIDNFILPLSEFPRSTTFGAICTYVYSNGSNYTSVHRGIDFAAPEGIPIEAMGSGKVVMAVNRILTGYTIVIEHLPGVYSIYYHLSELLVQEDDIVGIGEIVGKVGNTGLSTGAHLHLALYVSGEYVNPEYFVLNKAMLYDF